MGNFVHFYFIFHFQLRPVFHPYFVTPPLPSSIFLAYTKKKKKNPFTSTIPPGAGGGALLPHCHLLLKRTSPLTHIAAPPSLRFTSSQPPKKTPTTPLAFIYIPTLLFSGLCESNTSGEGRGFQNDLG